MRELDNLSAMIAQIRHKHLCENGMVGKPECRTLAQASDDIRRAYEGDAPRTSVPQDSARENIPGSLL